MATKKTAEPKSKNKGKATKPKTQTKKREPPKREQAVIVRRNASPMRTRDVRATRQEPKRAQAEGERTPLTERIDSMGGSHVTASIGAGMAGSALAVAAVGKGWVGPKTGAGILMGAGAVGMVAGWWLEWDHLMTAGAGLAAAGTFSVANQVSVEAYDALEKRAAEKRAEKEAEEEEKEQQKRLAEARAVIEEDAKKKQRNARRIVILDRDGRPIGGSQPATA